MRLASRQRILGGVLAAMVLWLPVHRFLVVDYDANPWKFAGWAMYALPQPSVRVEFFAVEADGLRPLAVDQTVPPFRDPVVDFLTRRKHAGALVRPDELTAPVFELYPDVETLAVVVTHVVVDPATAREVPKRFGYRYRRSEPRDVRASR
jgi:hypothetical protein